MVSGNGDSLNRKFLIMASFLQIFPLFVLKTQNIPYWLTQLLRYNDFKKKGMLFIMIQV